MLGKTKVTAPLLLVFLLITTCPAGARQSSGGLPPAVKKYSSPDSVEKTARDKTEIYTNGDAMGVIAFYRNSLGFEPDANGYFFVGWDALNKARPSEADARVGVAVNRENKSRQIKDSDLFEYFKIDIAINGKHSEQDLAREKQKYSHLTTAWYPDYEPKRKLQECRDSRGTAAVSASTGDRATSKEQEKELVARMEDLLAQGRYQEAGQLGRQRSGDIGAASSAVKTEGARDNWVFWTGCLDELDQHDYRTKIEIDHVLNIFKPSTTAERKTYAGYAVDEQNRLAARRQKKEDTPATPLAGDINQQMEGLRKMFKF